MKRQVALIVRMLTGGTLLLLSIDAVRGEGFVCGLSPVEIAAAAAFCLPGLWRVGGAALLFVLLLGLTHHAPAGQFAAPLFFASLVVTRELADERP
jgi:hypothetical protein